MKSLNPLSVVIFAFLLSIPAFAGDKGYVGEEGTEIEVVIANINRKDREIILSLRALEKQEEKSALKDNALKNKEIEEATKSNIGDLIKAEMQDADKENE